MYTPFRVFYKNSKEPNAVAHLPHDVDLTIDTNVDEQYNTVRFVFQFDEDTQAYENFKDILSKVQEGDFIEKITFENDTQKVCMKYALVYHTQKHNLVEIESAKGDVVWTSKNTEKEPGKQRDMQIAVKVQTLSILC